MKKKNNFNYFLFAVILSALGSFSLAKSADAAIVSTPFAWVPNVISNNVSKINTDTNSTSTINVNTNPQGVAVDASGYVWVANFNSNNVSKINASTGVIVATINVGSHPQGVAIDSSGYVWVTNYSDGNVSKIDASNNSVLKTVNVGSNPSIIAADSSGYIWVTNYGSNNVSKINTGTDSVEATIAVGTGPKCIAVDTSGFVWVANTAGDMSKIDPSNNSVVAAVNAGAGTYGVTIDVNGYVWATSYSDNSAAKIDPSSNTVVATVSSFNGPAGIAADVSGNVWVVNSNDNRVLKVNSSTNEIIDTINVGTSPFAWGDFTGFAYQYIVLDLPLSIISPTISLSPASSINISEATLNGEVTDDGYDTDNIDVTVYWGASDGGTTPADWDHSSNLGTQGVAAFAKNIDSLSSGTKYYFSASATNSAGTSWPAASLNFTTSLPDAAETPALTEEADEGEKARINSWSAYLYTDVNKSCNNRLKLTIKGRHFDKDAQVFIGGHEALSVGRKNSKLLVAKFCLEKLLSDMTDHIRAISVKNTGTSERRADKQIDLENILSEDVISSSSEQQQTNTYSGDAKPNVCSYTIQDGDILWTIAKNIYGDATAYPLIVESNKQQHPEIVFGKLSIGEELKFDNCQ